MTSFEKPEPLEPEAVLLDGVAENKEGEKTPEQLQREGKLRALALQAQNAFSVAVDRYEESAVEAFTLPEDWQGEHAPMLATFLHVCREALDQLGLQDISVNDVVRLIEHEIPANWFTGREVESISSVLMNDRCIYSATVSGKYFGEIRKDHAKIPEEFRTPQDRIFDRLAFEKALSQLLTEHGK